MYNKNEIYFLSENTFINNIYFLTQGIFATAICSYYGFPALLSTAIIAFPILFVNLQVFSSILFQKANNKKMYVLINNILSKLFLALSFASVLFANYGAVLFVCLYILGHTFYNLIVPVQNQWLVNSVSEKSRSSYFAVREFLFLLTFSFFNFIAGQFINSDNGNGMQSGFAKFSLMLIIFSIISFISIIKINTDVGINKDKLTLKKIITMPFKHKRFSKILVSLGLFNFSLWFTSSFANVFAIQILEIDINFVVIINAAALFFRTIAIPVFNKIADKNGWKIVISIGFLSMAASQLLWVFINSQNAPVIYSAIVMLQNFAFGSLGTGLYVAQLFNMPTSNKNIYFSSAGFISGLSGTLSAIISIVMVSLLVPNGITLFNINIPYHIIFFGINTILYIITVLYFALKINIMKTQTYNLALKTETTFFKKI